MEEFDTYNADIATVDVADTSPLRQARWWITSMIVLQIILSIGSNFFISALADSLGISTALTIRGILVLICVLGWGISGFILRKTNNSYIRHAGTLIIAFSVVEIIINLIPFIAQVSLSPFIMVTECLITLTLVMAALIAILYAGDADIMQAYKLAMLYVAQFGLTATLWFGGVEFSINVGIIIAIVGIIIQIMLIKPWWKLLGTAQPVNDDEEQPIASLFNNQGTIGFFATGLTMAILIYIIYHIMTN